MGLVLTAKGKTLTFPRRSSMLRERVLGRRRVPRGAVCSERATHASFRIWSSPEDGPLPAGIAGTQALGRAPPEREIHLPNQLLQDKPTLSPARLRAAIQTSAAHQRPVHHEKAQRSGDACRHRAAR